MVERLAFLLDGVPEAERMARCRELRALSLVYLGLDHPVTMALAAAVTDPAAGAAHAVSAIISAPCVIVGVVAGVLDKGFDSIRLNQGPKVHYTRPAADPLFISAAETHGKRVMGVVLSGGNSDGTAGLRAIAEHGGTALVQDPKEQQCLTCRARRLRRIIPMLA
jgi:hypothetical protein